MPNRSKLHQQLEGNPAFVTGRRRAQTYILIGNELRSMREARGYTQGQLAQQVHMDQGEVSNLEDGIWGEHGVSIDTLNRLVSAFGLRVTYVVMPVAGTRLTKEQKARVRFMTEMLQPLQPVV